ncbi:pantoate kinase [Archaeoglobus neptunius]|uniref:pantoate kinase n=1 Tax=Archaeoglobus neptunius TaxID=2798580 RepID=UPI00192690F4|nr:pantoate kinase [Archaeoglobus neptunius]
MIFVPASITCIFSPQVSDSPRNSGSIGVGFTVNLGVKAYKSEKTRINGEDWSFPTIDYVVERAGLEGADITADLPFGCGFGMSGAAALATAVLSGIPYIQAADLAHEAEVLNLTGLGDVVTQTFGGIVVRKNAACPSLASIERFCFDAILDFVVMGEISTRDIISDDIHRKKIGESGKKWVKEFLKRPTLENLFSCSRNFASETGLLDCVSDAVEAVESSGGMAGMVMLGKTVFAVNGFEALKEFGEPFKAKLDGCGVRRIK